jgi:DNA primase
VFPVKDRIGDVVAIQGRAIGPDERGPKVLTRGELGAGVFRTNDGALGEPLVTLVEAPIDALTLQVAGVSTVAVCGTNVPNWLPEALAFRRIALAFDADAAGDTASTKAASEFRAMGCHVERCRPNGKDWNQVLMEFGIEALTRELQADFAAGAVVR